VIIADGCAHLVNAVFDDHAAFSGLDHLVAVYAFAFQIYGDFSGYSDIAVGLAGLLGFHLMPNFDRPYFATNPSDLWRRWHISLSTWLRDYLYIPLGGNRGGPLRTYRNLILTMALGGLWHGAQWTMIVWGLYHGAALALHRLVTGAPRPSAPGVQREDPWRTLKILAMFQVTCLGWLVFRAKSLGQVGDMLVAMATDLRGTDWTLPAVATLVQLTWILIAYEVAQHVSGDPWLVFRWSPVRRVAFALVVVYSATFYWMLNRSLVQGGQPFIYFQF
jgi:D-alanyl-lipoteichoic acid acyltransferase DltB (MBOAT superfamily)